MLTLYQIAASGNCYRVRLMLALLNLRAEIEEVVDERFLRTPKFLALNPFGQVPVLTDGRITLRDSQAILIYLARAYGSQTWLPLDAANLAAVAQWLSFSSNEIQHGPRMARGIKIFGRPGNLKEAQHKARQALTMLDQALSDRDWLATADPTIADIACYPYVHVAHEGDIDTTGYHNVRSWLDRIERLPGFHPLDPT